MVFLRSWNSRPTSHSDTPLRHSPADHPHPARTPPPPPNPQPHEHPPGAHRPTTRPAAPTITPPSGHQPTTRPAAPRPPHPAATNPPPNPQPREHPTQQPPTRHPTRSPHEHPTQQPPARHPTRSPHEHPTQQPPTRGCRGGSARRPARPPPDPAATNPHPQPPTPPDHLTDSSPATPIPPTLSPPVAFTGRTRASDAPIRHDQPGPTDRGELPGAGRCNSPRSGPQHHTVANYRAYDVLNRHDRPGPTDRGELRGRGKTCGRRCVVHKTPFTGIFRAARGMTRLTLSTSAVPSFDGGSAAVSEEVSPGASGSVRAVPVGAPHRNRRSAAGARASCRLFTVSPQFGEAAPGR